MLTRCCCCWLVFTCWSICDVLVSFIDCCHTVHDVVIVAFWQDTVITWCVLSFIPAKTSSSLHHSIRASESGTFLVAVRQNDYLELILWLFRINWDISGSCSSEWLFRINLESSMYARNCLVSIYYLLPKIKSNYSVRLSICLSNLYCWVCYLQLAILVGVILWSSTLYIYDNG